MLDIGSKEFRAVQAILLFSLIKGDRATTPNYKCNGNSYYCTNGGCIPYTFVCNNVDNCGDNSDESYVCDRNEVSSRWYSYVGLFVGVCIVIACFSWRIQRRRRMNRMGLSNQTQYPTVPGSTDFQTQSCPFSYPTATTTTGNTPYGPWTTQTPIQPPPYSREGPGSIPLAPPPPYSEIAPESTVSPPFAGFTNNQSTTQTRSQQNNEGTGT